MAEIQLKAKILPRSDTEANWSSVNPSILPQELIYITDKNDFKINGTGAATNFSNLQYLFESKLLGLLTEAEANTKYLQLTGGNITGNLDVDGSLTVGTLSGLLKATSGVVAAAVAGTDYPNPAIYKSESIDFPISDDEEGKSSLRIDKDGISTYRYKYNEPSDLYGTIRLFKYIPGSNLTQSGTIQIGHDPSESLEGGLGVYQNPYYNNIKVFFNGSFSVESPSVAGGAKLVWNGNGSLVGSIVNPSMDTSLGTATQPWSNIFVESISNGSQPAAVPPSDVFNQLIINSNARPGTAAVQTFSSIVLNTQTGYASNFTDIGLKIHNTGSGIRIYPITGDPTAEPGEEGTVTDNSLGYGKNYSFRRLYMGDMQLYYNSDEEAIEFLAE